MNKLTACALALLATTACGDGTDDRCVDGVYDGTAVLVSDGFLFQTYPSLLSPGSREVVPYSAAPFLSCRVLGGILMQTADAVLDSEHYPLLEELGFITIEPLDNGGPRIVDDLSGFDDVVRFGGIGNPFALTRQASVRVISGFNNVEVVEGSLKANGTVTGFGALRVVEDSYDVGNIVDQTQLESASAAPSTSALRSKHRRSCGCKASGAICAYSRLARLKSVSPHCSGSMAISSSTATTDWSGGPGSPRVQGSVAASMEFSIPRFAMRTLKHGWRAVPRRLQDRFVFVPTSQRGREHAATDVAGVAAGALTRLARRGDRRALVDEFVAFVDVMSALRGGEDVSRKLR